MHSHWADGEVHITGRGLDVLSPTEAEPDKNRVPSYIIQAASTQVPTPSPNDRRSHHHQQLATLV